MKAAVAAAGAIGALALPASALAAEGAALYPGDVEQRSFVTSDGGWERGSSTTGLCLPPLTCPSIGGGFVASGGTFGASDGYLNTTIGGLTGVGSESRGILRGPEFTYNGVNGEKATALVFGISHLVDLESLLQVAGNSADFTVEIVRVGGVANRVVDQKPLVNDESWTEAGPIELNPTALKLGEKYRIRVITRFEYGVEVLEGGSVGYDDIGLLAVREESGDGDGDGDGNGDGNGDNKPGNNSAVFDGRNLFIKLKCFGEQGKNGKCQSRATALKTKKGARYTFPIQRIVKAKKGKVIRARVRFKFRKELEQRKSIVLKSVLRENRKDKSATTKYKKLKLIDRG